MTRDHAVWLRSILENAAQSLDDATAIRVKEFYPAWAAGLVCAMGLRYRHGGKLYKCRQSHTAQAGWEPGAAGTQSLFEEVNETHAGTEADPIPYNGNMALENGKYYVQDYVIYLCNRDTINPVYNTLSELVGLYVEIV